MRLRCTVKSKYCSLGESSFDESFDDKICVEVIFRNFGIRKSVIMNKNEATRVIEVENKP